MCHLKKKKGSILIWGGGRGMLLQGKLNSWLIYFKEFYVSDKVVFPRKRLFLSIIVLIIILIICWLPQSELHGVSSICQGTQESICGTALVWNMRKHWPVFPLSALFMTGIAELPHCWPPRTGILVAGFIILINYFWLADCDAVSLYTWRSTRNKAVLNFWVGLFCSAV